MKSLNKIFLNVLSLSLLISVFNVNAVETNSVSSISNGSLAQPSVASKSLFESFEEDQNTDVLENEVSDRFFNKVNSYIKESIQNQDKKNIIIIGIAAAAISGALIYRGVKKYYDSANYDKQIKILNDAINGFAKEVLDDNMKKKLRNNFKATFVKKQSTLEKITFVLDSLEEYYDTFNDKQKELYKELCETAISLNIEL